MDHRIGGTLAYTVDDQGRVLAVQEGRQSDAPPAQLVLAPVALRTLVAPLTWEPVQRLLAWGAREGMTAAELLDSCRTATRPPATRTPRGRAIGDEKR